MVNSYGKNKKIDSALKNFDSDKLHVKRLYEIKEYFGLKSDTEALRFCLTFTWRKFCEIQEQDVLKKECAINERRNKRKV